MRKSISTDVGPAVQWPRRSSGAATPEGPPLPPTNHGYQRQEGPGAWRIRPRRHRRLPRASASVSRRRSRSTACGARSPRRRAASLRPRPATPGSRSRGGDIFGLQDEAPASRAHRRPAGRAGRRQARRLPALPAARRRPARDRHRLRQHRHRHRLSRHLPRRRSALQTSWKAEHERPPQAVEDLLEALYMPRLIRHIQVLYRGMIDAGTRIYFKVGTSGTGGMGLNVPYTHSEEKPSRVLLSKSAVAGAHSMLLFLMARTPGAPITKEIKPAAAIAWKQIGHGPIQRGGEPIAAGRRRRRGRSARPSRPSIRSAGGAHRRGARDRLHRHRRERHLQPRGVRPADHRRADGVRHPGGDRPHPDLRDRGRQHRPRRHQRARQRGARARPTAPA